MNFEIFGSCSAHRFNVKSDVHTGIFFWFGLHIDKKDVDQT